MNSDPSGKGALSGIRVVDLSRILAGPLCTMNLGDLGAEVIKVEQPGRGDDTRGWGPPFAGKEAAYFLGVNRNKRGITLNLKETQGQELLRSLLRSADVLVENFKVGTLEGWGITDAWREREAPRLIHCQITGYGKRGPLAGMPGYDFLLQAESGLMSITGEQQGGPMKLGVAIVDVCTGLYAAMGILAALQARGRTGRGQRVEATLYASSISMLINVASNYLVSGRTPGRFGNGHPNIVPYREYDCADGKIALAVGNDTQFARLAECLGHPEWAGDQRFRSNADRVRNRDATDAMVAAVLVTRRTADWLADFRKAAIPCGPLQSVDAALENPQTEACDMVVEMEHAAAGTIRTLGIPYSLSDTPVSIRHPSPVLGADTDTVLEEILGMNPGEIEECRRDGVI